ncbi:MAG: extracellular solute-binding protein [Lachnospiraceae bacterium]|jgi:arabinogalactan oligomer/maltooligosaccharide transport system substrate-binding protein|nr:extracellular solute-binding protein [Lachnospiraceae bacterium]
MNYKKRFYAALLTVVLAAGVFAVGKSGIQMKAEQEQAQQESFLNRRKDTLRLWYTDESLTDYLNAAAVAYGERSDVRVEAVLISDSEYVEEINEASLGRSEKEKPDLYLITNDCLEKAHLAGLAKEIADQDMFRVIDFENGGAEAAVTYDGKVVAYPFYYEACALLYNKTYLKDYARLQLEAEADLAAGEAAQAEADAGNVEEEAAGEESGHEFSEEEIARKAQECLPDTIAELEDFADNYNAPEQVEAVFKWDVSDILYNYSFAGDHLIVGGENGDDPERIDIYNLETLQCLTTFQNLNQFFSIETRGVSYESVMQDFLDGKIVFTVAGTEAVNRMAQAQADGSFAYEYGYYNMPDLTEELKSRSLSITTCIAINGYTEFEEEANDFARFMMQDWTSGLNLQESTGKMPVYGYPLYDELYTFAGAYNESMPIPKMMTTGNFWVQMEIAFTNIWEGGDVNALLKSLSEQVMSQVTGEEYTEEYIELPVEEVPEEEYIEEPQG